MIYCCTEHVELAMDVIVDEYEVAPNLKMIEGNNEKLSTTCEYCGNKPMYIVSN
jgi:CxxH/CxxC protein (TIGR04129 family)